MLQQHYGKLRIIDVLFINLKKLCHICCRRLLVPGTLCWQQNFLQTVAQLTTQLPNTSTRTKIKSNATISCHVSPTDCSPSLWHDGCPHGSLRRDQRNLQQEFSKFDGNRSLNQSIYLSGSESKLVKRPIYGRIVHDAGTPAPRGENFVFAAGSHVHAKVCSCS